MTLNTNHTCAYIECDCGGRWASMNTCVKCDRTKFPEDLIRRRDFINRFLHPEWFDEGHVLNPHHQ